jgi:hypothetical protein
MPENAWYFHAAYIAATVIYGVYIISLLVRTKRARERERRAGLAGTPQA